MTSLLGYTNKSINQQSQALKCFNREKLKKIIKSELASIKDSCVFSVDFYPTFVMQSVIYCIRVPMQSIAAFKFDQRTTNSIKHGGVMLFVFLNHIRRTLNKTRANTTRD